MKRKLVLLVFTFFISQCRSQLFTTCPITDGGAISPPFIQVDNIDDVGSIDISWPFDGPLILTTPVDTDTGAKYIDAFLDTTNKQLIIRTNNNFTTDFEQDQIGIGPTPQIPIQRAIELTCTGEGSPQRLNLNFYVVDTNNHDPTFAKSEYTFTMPMPLVPKIDLTNFGEQIIALDLDFFNTDVTFSVDSDAFILETEADATNRNYRAILKVKEFVTFDTGLQLHITATDNGDPTRTGTATINIQRDNEVSIADIPIFSELIYEYTYSLDVNPPALVPVDGSKQIVVTTSDSSATTVALDANPYFDASYDPGTNIVTLNVLTPIDATSEQIMAFELTVTHDSETSKTAIIVRLPSQLVITTPTFTLPYYTAKYTTNTDPHKVELTSGQLIAINEDNLDVQMDLSGDPYFKIDLVGGVWTLSVDTNIDDTILNKGGDYILTLHATVTDNGQTYEGYGVVVIELPKILEVPRFPVSYYAAQYIVATDGTTDTVEISNGPINIVQTDETAEIVLESYANPDLNFILTNANGDGWTVTVLNNLPTKVVNKGGDIVLSLAAVVSGVENGTGTLVIQLPDILDPPTFTLLYYTAKYTTDTEPHQIELTSAQPIAINENNLDVQIDLSGDPYFNIDLVDGVWTLSVNQNIPDSILNEEEYYVLTLHATANVGSGVVQTSEAVILIKLPDTCSSVLPTFSKPYYRAVYHNDTVPYLVVDDVPIQVTNEDGQSVDVVFVGENSQYFYIFCDPTSLLCSPVVLVPLPEDILAEEVVVLMIEAVLPGINEKGLTVLIITLSE